MKNFAENAGEASGFAAPFMKKTSDFFTGTGDSARRWYFGEKKKYIRRRRISRLKKFMHSTIGVIVIIAGILAAMTAFVLALRAFIQKVCLSNHKIATDECAAQSGSAENEPDSDEAKPGKKAPGKRNGGYITL
ncbi:MAG TPA: hypothetical protein H9900_04130 [Candidatus Monoglobus merdigallinarum]|uniref:Uncharacterized protein n=1 Tax=Candidatus Monoglobus merdigallinarum TaxID=2838698 RepID=A0A9D1PS87_9FIRM|nr:hypothetical protein [Candidatus Monoglobus merdigallinarum]